MQSFLAGLFTFVFALAIIQPVHAQSPVDITGVGVTYMFGDQIIFTANLQAQLTIRKVSLLVRMKGEQNGTSFPLSLSPDGGVTYTYSIQNNSVRPFSSISFWFIVLLTDNGSFESPHYYFQYDDNRFAWRTLTGNGLNFHWYSGEAAFGQTGIRAAEAGYAAFRSLFAIPPGDPIDIYVYASPTDEELALNSAMYEPVDGRSIPDLDVVMVSIPPGENQDAELGSRIPQELAYLLFHRLTGPAYSTLPAWFVQGAAMRVSQSPQTEFAATLKTAADNNTLLPIAGLCGTFPVDASGSRLAFAESDSFVHYLDAEYGPSGLQGLLQAYARGSNCDQGISQEFHLSLALLDRKWRQASLGEKTPLAAISNLIPYLVLLAVLLIVPLWLYSSKIKKKGLTDDGKPE